MKKIDLGQTITILANIGVIVGLIFLVLQLRQNAELMRVEINQARSDSAMVSLSEEFNSAYIPGIRAKIRNGDELTEEEWLRYVGWFRAVNRTQDNALSQFDAGMLGNNTPRSVGDFVVAVIAASDYARKAWDETKVGYTNRYISFVDDALRAFDEN